MVVVGPSGSGKTTVWSLLKTALNRTGNTVKHYVMNPKAMPRTQVLQSDSSRLHDEVGNDEVMMMSYYMS